MVTLLPTNEQAKGGLESSLVVAVAHVRRSTVDNRNVKGWLWQHGSLYFKFVLQIASALGALSLYKHQQVFYVGIVIEYL
jgi:hypothetical protein